MTPEPLKNKTVAIVDFVDTIDHFKGGNLFKKEDVASAVEWYRNKLLFFQRKASYLDESDKSYNFAINDAIRYLDEAFEDVIREKNGF